MGSVQNVLESTIADAMGIATQAFAAGEWQLARESFTETSQWIGSGLPVLALWALYGPQELDDYSTPLGQAVLSSKGSDYLRLLHLAETAAAQAELAALHWTWTTRQRSLQAQRRKDWIRTKGWQPSRLHGRLSSRQRKQLKTSAKRREAGQKSFWHGMNQVWPMKVPCQYRVHMMVMWPMPWTRHG
jgi:hypothetical protein